MSEAAHLLPLFQGSRSRHWISVTYGNLYYGMNQSNTQHIHFLWLSNFQAGPCNYFRTLPVQFRSGPVWSGPGFNKGYIRSTYMLECQDHSWSCQLTAA